MKFILIFLFLTSVAGCFGYELEGIEFLSKKADSFNVTIKPGFDFSWGVHPLPEGHVPLTQPKHHPLLPWDHHPGAQGIFARKGSSSGTCNQWALSNFFEIFFISV